MTLSRHNSNGNWLADKMPPQAYSGPLAAAPSLRLPCASKPQFSALSAFGVHQAYLWPTCNL